MIEPTLHSESPTSAALDGARIAAFLATVLASSDPQLSAEQREVIVDSLGEAQMWLDNARRVLLVETTSVHVVHPANERAIIIPGA